jgi:hypothetical protein
MKTNFKINDRVQYNDKFLNQISADLEIASLTGTIKDIKYYPNIKKTVIKIQWDNEEELSSSLPDKLKIVK